MQFYVDVVQGHPDYESDEADGSLTTRLYLGTDFQTAYAAYNLICGHNLYTNATIDSIRFLVRDNAITLTLHSTSLSGKNDT